MAASELPYTHDDVTSKGSGRVRKPSQRKVGSTRTSANRRQINFVCRSYTASGVDAQRTWRVE